MSKKPTLIERAEKAGEQRGYKVGTDAGLDFRAGWYNGYEAGRRDAARRAKPARKGKKAK